MDSSTDAAAAVRALGALLTRAEADAIAARLSAGESFTSALSTLGSSRRPDASALITSAGLRQSRNTLVTVLRAIAGARGVGTGVGTLWTMPGHLAQTSPLTTSLTRLIAGARASVVCSTYNFQQTSGLWTALHEAAVRPELVVRVYIDAKATAQPASPDAAAIARHLHPGVVLRTRTFQGNQVRNHAKFVCVDHRFLVVTSANFSWSAEYGNVELGITIDDADVADSVEREMRSAETAVYERVPGR
ncbi:DISARM system phospholipase D-like protein DrmC [Cellulomonas sp. zg-ZUI40]|nr:DISARM system phospholipase D-like protein DrmC [Cellulomonas dongxiuzhuiae]